MADIAEFLEAQYRNDEHYARAASGTLGIVRPWHQAAKLREALPGMQRADCFFIEHQTPGRALAEIAAKRRRLERHGYDFPYDPDDGPGDYSWTPYCDACNEPWPCVELLDDASVYEDRPGFDLAWKRDV